MKKLLILVLSIIAFTFLISCEQLAPHEHEWREASCVSPKTCLTCGQTEGTNAEHEFKPANCIMPKVCISCGLSQGSPLGHEWHSATCIAPRTCAACGLTEGTSLSHDWRAATCLKPRTCIVCGETEGKSLGHNWKAPNCTTPKTCSECGETEGKPIGHDWKAASCTKPKTCLTCGDTEGTVAEHEYLEQKNVPATCLSNGYSHKSCIYCGDNNIVEIPKIDHEYIPPTCSSPMRCKYCSATVGNPVSHADNGNGYCVYCNKKMIIANLENKISARLIVASSGTNNAYFYVEFVNNSGYDMILSTLATGNGKLCYNASLKDYVLHDGYKVTVTYYRGVIPSQRFDKKYYDMYMDSNSWGYTTVDINGTTVFFRMFQNSSPIIGLSLSDIGVPN